MEALPAARIDNACMHERPSGAATHGASPAPRLATARWAALIIAAGLSLRAWLAAQRNAVQA